MSQNRSALVERYDCDREVIKVEHLFFINTDENGEFCEEQDSWEQELDNMGPSADLEQLQEMLNRAPDPRSEMAQYLRGYVAGRVNCKLG